MSLGVNHKQTWCHSQCKSVGTESCCLMSMGLSDEGPQDKGWKCLKWYHSHVRNSAFKAGPKFITWDLGITRSMRRQRWLWQQKLSARQRMRNPLQWFVVEKLAWRLGKKTPGVWGKLGHIYSVFMCFCYGEMIEIYWNDDTPLDLL